jgi:presqualene diphosphate synthase
MSQSPEVEAAEAKARSSSFYAGMKVLPEAERAAMFAIYAFCRAVDDIADEQGLDPAVRRRDLDAWRADLDELYRGGAGGRAAFLKPAVDRFGLAQADFLAVIDGMQMDVDADIRAPSLDVLDLYCDRVASAVGRLSVRVFGMEDAPGEALARHLGRALQLTNILRDLDEDAGIGRLYMAREWLDAAGIATDDPAAVVADPRIDAAARIGAALAHEHYAAADRVMAGRTKGRLLAPKLMSAVYGAILKRMEQEGWAAPRARVKPGKGELLVIVARRLVLGR